MYPLGFPATESGVELKILKKRFRKDDAELFSTMTQRLDTAEQRRIMAKNRGLL